MRTGLYGQLKKTTPIALISEIDEIGQTYTDMAIAGTCRDSQRQFFIGAGQRLRDAGADAVVLAGTDLNLAFDNQQTDYRVVDALDVHVDLLARIGAGGEKLA